MTYKDPQEPGGVWLEGPGSPQIARGRLETPGKSHAGAARTLRQARLLASVPMLL